tara:strand:- start:21 stop:206 length:186 start_codon:yes stop_codon:yes gene_type:complete
MGLAAFRRARRREAAVLVASIPESKPKIKRKRKPKAKPLTNGNNDSGDSGVSHSEQLHHSF